MKDFWSKHPYHHFENFRYRETGSGAMSSFKTGNYLIVILINTFDIKGKCSLMVPVIRKIDITNNVNLM